MIVGIGGEMLAQFENGFAVVVSADSAGELGGSQSVTAILDKIIGDLVLKVDDGGGGFFAGFKTWLMTGVDLDLGGVKTQSMFEKAMRRPTGNGETDFIVIVINSRPFMCKAHLVPSKKPSK